MSSVKALVRRAVSAVPAWVKRDGLHVALVFAAAFVGTAKPLLPSLTTTPGFAAAKAAIVAAVVAGVKAGIRAAEPVAIALAVKVAYKVVAHVEAKKAAEKPCPLETPVKTVVVSAPSGQVTA